MRDAILKTKTTLTVGSTSYAVYNPTLLSIPGFELSRLPFSIRVLLENLLRNFDENIVKEKHVETLAKWNGAPEKIEIPFFPSRVLMQDFTGVPCIADLAAMRDVAREMGKNPASINPLVPVDLVIDHSVQVDYYGVPDAYIRNTSLEFQRNEERYKFLKWAQASFRNFTVVPPGMGIVHQVNLEFLAKVVQAQKDKQETFAFPDTLVGTDSHTTMVNGLGVVGWGVGGIEAEAVMLGQPYFMLVPEVVGVYLKGELQEGVTATDLVLHLTNLLRKVGVVDKFVEFHGSGLKNLSLADRATIANMSPEYGATIGFFPVDGETLDYLRTTGRSEEQVELVEKYAKAIGLFYENDCKPVYSQVIEVDLSEISATLAGPTKPHDKVGLGEMKVKFEKDLPLLAKRQDKVTVEVLMNGSNVALGDGSVVIAAITSCTNTSNPVALITAGLLAKKAVELGLHVKPIVKTSLAPGSRAVIDYLQRAGLMPFLEQLGFYTVGFGCTTCIGNSGPLPEPVSTAIKQGNLVAAAVLSGNRNFEARIHSQVKANYLASPALVVAYAIAGRVDFDPLNEPLTFSDSGQAVFLRDVWPSMSEVKSIVRNVVTPDVFHKHYATVFDGDEQWRALDVAKTELFQWDVSSTYVKKPPFFDDFSLSLKSIPLLRNCRVLAVFGDSVTTDHISPAGSINADGPAGKYLISKEVVQRDFNSFGSRRGNHDVMIRGTFANIRIKNLLLNGVEGGFTTHFPSGKQLSIFEAAELYQQEGTPLMVIAGKEYGAGSSRDWAAKGPALLGVKAVIAESFERIHRSNLIGMGVLPLQFNHGENFASLGLNGSEVFDIDAGDLAPRKKIKVVGRRENFEKEFEVTVLLNSSVEVDYYRNGGILNTVLRKLFTK